MEKDKTNEEGYKAISVLYVFTKDEKNLRDWIMARANDPNMTNEKRADAYAILSGKDWDCSFRIPELPDATQTSTEGASAQETYKKPRGHNDRTRIHPSLRQC